MSLEVVYLAFSCGCQRGEAGEVLGKRLEVAGAWRLLGHLLVLGLVIAYCWGRAALGSGGGPGFERCLGMNQSFVCSS
jgi:hypothetical protein